MLNKSLVSNFTFIYITIVLVAKLMRYTIMYNTLVARSIGHIFLSVIYHTNVTFSISDFISGSAEEKTIMFFSLFHHFDVDNPYFYWELAFTLILNVMVFNVLRDYLKTHPFVQNINLYFIYLNVGILNIFCFNMSKEPYQMLFWFIMLHAIKGQVVFKKGLIRLLIALFITIFLSRKYYGLIGIYIFAVMYFVDFRLKNINLKYSVGRLKFAYNILLLFAFMAVVYFVVNSFLKINNEQSYEAMMYVNSRQGFGAKSEIAPLFGGGSLAIMTLEYFVKIFRLMFPVELLLKGNITYLFVIVFQFMLFVFLVNSYKHRTTNSVECNLATDLYVAFWLTSATFEPDFGSWVRHEGVAFPVILYILAPNNRNYNILS